MLGGIHQFAQAAKEQRSHLQKSEEFSMLKENPSTMINESNSGINMHEERKT